MIEKYMLKKNLLHNRSAYVTSFNNKNIKAYKNNKTDF